LGNNGYQNLIYGFLTKFSYTTQNVSTIDNESNEKLGENSNQIIESIVGEKLTENQNLILTLISENNSITAKAIALYIGISLRKVEMNISKLKQKGHLQRIGPDKGGYWLVIER
jgi:ATP-dependent DNA helicase RecG